MVGDTDILRVGNSKPNIEPKEPDKGDWSRRKFIAHLSTWAGLLGLNVFLLVEHLKSKAPKSIDDYADPTNVIINRLGEVTMDNVKLLGAGYGETNAYFKVRARIKSPTIQQYLVTYYFSDLHFPDNEIIGHEEMSIELVYPPGEEKSPIDKKGFRYWCFRGRGPLDASDFSYHSHGYEEKHVKFEPGYGIAAVENIRRLLKIDEHIQNYRQNRTAQKPA